MSLWNKLYFGSFKITNFYKKEMGPAFLTFCKYINISSNNFLTIMKILCILKIIFMLLSAKCLLIVIWA